MSLTNTLRRTAVGIAASAMLLGGALGFVTLAGTAVAEGNATAAVVVTTVPANGIALNNVTAAAETDCPTGGAAYWHFVLAPNNGSTFVSITLNLGTETRTFSGAEIIENGSQTDNVFVAVPAGFTLTSIVKSGSYAVYSGATPNNFNLSHVCEGTVPTTPTSSSSTTSSSTTSSSITSSSTTSSSTTSSSTTSTTAAPTTTTAPETTTTVEVLGTVQTLPPTTAAEVLGAVQVNGELPYTGTNTSGMVAAGLAVLLGGALLVGLARTKGRDLGEQ